MQKCYVYIICDTRNGSNGPIKIGVANDPEKRILDLQVGNPYPLILRAKIECSGRKKAYFLESFLHRRFARSRMSGEWFNSRGCNLPKAFKAFEDLGYGSLDAKKVSKDKIYGSKHMRSVKQLESENSALVRMVEKLENDIAEYLDSECMDRVI